MRQFRQLIFPKNNRSSSTDFGVRFLLGTPGSHKRHLSIVSLIRDQALMAFLFLRQEIIKIFLKQANQLKAKSSKGVQWMAKLAGR